MINTYNNQSTATISVISEDGSPTVSNTITMVTSPACGMPAAPIEAAVAVILQSEKRYFQIGFLMEGHPTYLTATIVPNEYETPLN